MSSGIVRQPIPRGRSPSKCFALRFMAISFLLFLLTLLVPTGPTFSFIRPPGRPANAEQLLPTPTNTPPPNANSQGTRLTIPELVDHDARFEGSDTLGRALDALRRHAVGNAVLALVKEEEGEYILSARPFYDGGDRRGCEELWAELDRADEPELEPVPEPAHEAVLPSAAQPSTLSYLTPPSSPETACKRDTVPAARAAKSNLASGSCLSPIVDDEPPALADIPTLDLDDCSEPNFECGPWTDEPLMNESLEYLSDCDEFDWSYDNEDDDEYSDNEENAVVSTEEPGSPPPPYAHHPDPRSFTSFPKDIADLTAALDMSSFSEWPVARGGFGDVWKGALGVGAKTKVQRPIAVKRLTMYADAGEEGARKVMKRTARELSIWSRLHHANVLPLLGTCSFRGGVGIVAEWQQNGNATAWVNTNPEVDRLELCKGICAGLEYLHRSNVIHGDLRGANVLISPSGAPRLIDFGLASVVGPNPAFSASATMAGTVRWMAPELQVTEGQKTTAASDMFAFGMTMLEMHTGLLPFDTIRNDIAVLLKYQRGERPPRPVPSVTKRGPRQRGGKKASVCVSMDDETWDIAQECWAQDARVRPCARKVLEWLIRKTRLK